MQTEDARQRGLFAADATSLPLNLIMQMLSGDPASAILYRTLQKDETDILSDIRQFSDASIALQDIVVSL